MNWHYSDGVNQFGPITREQFDRLVAAGRITRETLVWREGMTQWEPYAAALAVMGRTDAAPGTALGAGGGAPGLGTASVGVYSAPREGGGEEIPPVACATCGRLFPEGETLRYENMHVCADCKPIFFQRLKEGLAPSPHTMVYGGFWIRFGAKFIDGIFLGLMNWIFLLLSSLIFGTSLVETDPTKALTNMAFIYLISFSFGIAYNTFFVGKYAGTPGKLICGLRVVAWNGTRIGYMRALGRYGAELVTSMTFGIGYLIAIGDPERRALHDRIANTRVVYA